MTIHYTEDEREWLDRSRLFDTRIKSGCPDYVSETLLEKMKHLYPDRKNHFSTELTNES